MGRVLAWDAAHDRGCGPRSPASLEVLRDGAWSVFLVALLGHWRRDGSRSAAASPCVPSRCSLAGCAYLVLLVARCGRAGGSFELLARSA
jgi:hypothetical protein